MAACPRPFACRDLGFDSAPSVHIVDVTFTGGAFQVTFDTDVSGFVAGIDDPQVCFGNGFLEPTHPVRWVSQVETNVLNASCPGFVFANPSVWATFGPSALLSFVNGGETVAGDDGQIFD